MLDHMLKTYGSLGHGERTHQKGAALPKKKVALPKIKGTFLLQCLTAFCVLDNAGATAAASASFPSPSPTCGCSGEIAALQEGNQALQ